MPELKVLELYSGIGGMHLAFEASGVPGEVKTAIEINTNAVAIYKVNFPQTPVVNYNIVGLTAEKINKLDVDTILMSPPCQPFTRNGLQNDVGDARTDSFQHLLNLFPDLNVLKVLIENVQGFEKSKMRDILINKLEECSFTFQEFILSPTLLGVSNSRPRYYCLAKKLPDIFGFKTGELMYEFPSTCNIDTNQECFEIETILEDNINLDKYRLSSAVLRKRLKVLDICYNTSRKSCCFTKGYGRYIKGTGSVYTDKSETEVHSILEQLEKLSEDSSEYIELAESLNLRFFTPREVCRLMSFPDTFSFPKDISLRQQYMVLGNSINVRVVSELIKILCIE